jgi:hypothetical protein
MAVTEDGQAPDVNVETLLALQRLLLGDRGPLPRVGALAAVEAGGGDGSSGHFRRLLSGLGEAAEPRRAAQVDAGAPQAGEAGDFLTRGPAPPPPAPVRPF